MAYVIYKESMRYNPKNPKWFNRDRFVLSAGHGSMLQYALLHLAGYDSVSVPPPLSRLTTAQLLNAWSCASRSSLICVGRWLRAD